MKKFYIFLIGLLMMFSLNSCETYTYATTQDDIYVEAEADVVRSNVSFDVIISYGTPYYMNGTLLYYFYKDLYYYPFYYNNYWYVRAYRHPFTHFDRRPYFRPHRYDYRFSPGSYKGFGRAPVYHPQRHVTPRTSRPVVHPNNRTTTRPAQPRSNQRIDRNQNNHNRHGNFGGRR